MKNIRLNTEIDSRFLAEVELELVAINVQRSMDYRKRVLQSKIRAFALTAIKPVCILGLVLSPYVLWTARHSANLIRHDLIIALFFLVTLILAWDIKALEIRVNNFYAPLRRWLAIKAARRYLKTAKKIAPFLAEYDFRGDLVTYYRTKNEKSAVVWNRKLHGFSLSGTGFSLFYKKEKSLYPYAIILHEFSEEFSAYLVELNIKSMNTLATDDVQVSTLN